ncbi:RidA family protein [Brachybacterium sp. AOP25-B2-12]|uniref:RidA family protein n=1 Tax=Brachybacterium sp. AOP25-B2-12 TaxID=3457710 RepID=UPI00403432D6
MSTEGTTAKRAVVSEAAPAPVGPYSQAVVSGDLLFSAGFGPQDAAADNAVASTVGEQTRQVLRNIGAVLAESGAGFDDVLKTTVHLADLADFAEFNAAYGEFFSEPFPVRTTVGSSLANILVEIDVVARIPS